MDNLEPFLNMFELNLQNYFSKFDYPKIPTCLRYPKSPYRALYQAPDDLLNFDALFNFDAPFNFDAVHHFDALLRGPLEAP